VDHADSGARGPLAGSAEARRIYLEAADTLLERFAAESSLQRIVDLAVPVLADWCYIHLVATPHPRIVAIANADPVLAADARARAATDHPLSENTAIARVLAGGPSELVHVSDETLRAAAVDADHLAALRRRAFRSAVVAPLLGRDGVLGAVTFAMTESGRAYQTADLDMLAKLARRTGIALDNARLFAAERAARDRMVRLQQLTEKLSGTVAQGDVVHVMVDSGRTALGAAAGFAWLLAGHDQLELVAAEDPADRAPMEERYARFPLSRALPICEAVRSCRPLMFENLEAMLAAFPDAVPRNAGSYHAWAVVPFVASGRALGGVSFSFATERTFSDEDRALLATMTTQAAIALERAQLIAAERAAREAAESMTHQFAASEENLRVALVAGRAATWSLDLRTMRSVRDRTYLTLTGHHEVDAVGDFEQIHPDDREAARTAFERALRERVPYTPEVRILRGDGRYMWVRSHGRLVYDAEGVPSTLSGVMVDIDEAKQASLRAEHESQVNETLHRLAGEFASVLDHDQLVERIVDEVAKLIDAEVAAFVEGDAPTDGASEGFDWLSVPVIGPTGTRYGTLRFANRRPRAFTTAHIRLVASVSKHASVALENARLYREMQQREAELEAAVRAARVANHRKDEFLAMLGHELRNPVAPIVTALDLVELKTGALDREHRAIRRDVDHLRRLIDDLLDVSRITNGKLYLDKKPIDLGETLAQAIEMVGPLIAERGQTLQTEVGGARFGVEGDSARLVQVFGNLLTNAAKYSDPATTIHVRASATADAIQVDVRDEGIGLTPELREGLFDLFVQGERSLARSEGGLGIGLSVAKVICEAHGGTITVESEGLGRGSTFTVSLPRAAEVVAASPATEVKPRARILVVDDNVDAALMLHELFLSLGHDAEVAHDGFAALELAQAFEPNVAVLDIGLPQMDGYELARKLRQLRDLRLVAVTGYDSEEDRAKSREAGFDHHLAKPLKVDQLLRLLELTRE